MKTKHRNFKTRKTVLIIPFFLYISISSCKDSIVEIPSQPIEPIDTVQVEVNKMDWWNDARYGMFIHYGIYSALAGEYIGKNTEGKSIHFQSIGNKNSKVDTVQIGKGVGAEWILYEASIPRESYQKYASSFTAAKYDPQAIVSLAQKAGMKYIIITSKHHDGFCLWNSNVTPWNVSQTPAGIRWQNDLIAPLAQAARAAGLKFGIYFSHTRDWMHTGGVGPIPELRSCFEL